MIDIGVNLTHESFAHDLDGVLARAAESGVTGMIVTGTDPEHSAAALAMARERPLILRATAGIHPHHADLCGPQALRSVEQTARADQVVAVGECGLDFYRDFSPRDVQLSCFEAQLELAAEVGKPVFLHEREAHRALVRILEKYRPQLAGGVAHCFTGGVNELAAYLDLDLHVGVTGWICDERRGHALRESVARIPQARLLIETDAPYLLPRDLKPKPKSRRNEPAMLAHVCAAVGALRGEHPCQVATYTTANAHGLFGFPPDSQIGMNTADATP